MQQGARSSSCLSFPAGATRISRPAPEETAQIIQATPRALQGTTGLRGGRTPAPRVRAGTDNPAHSELQPQRISPALGSGMHGGGLRRRAAHHALPEHPRGPPTPRGPPPLPSPAQEGGEGE